MSALSNVQAQLSGKKRKASAEDQTDRATAKKQRRAETRRRLEAEATQKAQSNAREASLKNPEGKKKKKKRQRKHSSRGIGEHGQDDAPVIKNEPDVSAEKKSKRRESRRKRTETSPDDAKSLKVELSSDSNSHLPKDKLAKIQAWAEHSESESSKAAARKERKKSKSLEVSKPKSSWKLSPLTAGRYLDQDPIFIDNADGGEPYLIAANSREIQLLSLETSLVTNSRTAPKGRSIVCFASGTPHPSGMVTFALDDGSIYTWDFDIDEEIHFDIKAPRPVSAITSTRNGHLPWIYICPDAGKWDVFFNEEKQPVFSTDRVLTDIRVFGSGEYIVVSGPKTVVIGARKGENESTTYIWTQIPLASTLTCLDARILQTEALSKKTKKHIPGLSLAIGCTDGQVHLYDDISSISRQKGKPQLPTPRILHWHREAVASVKFSPDGNYLISGGKETVLVIWQLQTAKKQFLPHLTSAIERIVVNAKGDRYAMQMGDNSIMVLSTSELKPVAHFAGLQMAESINQSQAAILHPQHQNQIVLSVPSTRPENGRLGATSRPFLQAFDFNTSRHIARQALTRNNVTDFNLGPEGQPISPPDVDQIAISHDGSWLATVDEWMPPAGDVEHLVSDYSDIEALRESRREVYLKFWKWEESDGLWTLTTRVDSPSSVDGSSTGAGRILALISNPAANGFATVGEDCCVKIWKPKKRARHGVTIVDRSDSELFEWACKRTIQLPRSQERVDSPFSSAESTKSTTACLSYATDGSMLAASFSSTNTTEEAQIIHFINPATGESIPKPNLTAHNLVAMGFLDQYFIAVDALAAYVWDLVNDTILYKVKLASKKHPNMYSSPRLTVDAAAGTFALVTTVKDSGKTKVAVYSPKESLCLYETTFSVPVEAVLATASTKGYTLLFADATIRTLAPATGSAARMRRVIESMPADSAVAPAAAVQPTIEDAGDEMDVDPVDTQAASRQEVVDEDDRPVVRPEQLAGLFDTPQSFALPPVRDMFASVVGLFSRRPYSKPAVEAA